MKQMLWLFVGLVMVRFLSWWMYRSSWDCPLAIGDQALRQRGPILALCQQRQSWFIHIPILL
ncbi:MAG: hypothetical protein AAGJ35_00545, partial [Myxococcota bacterium]